MTLFAEDIKSLSVPEKAELYKLLQNDEELKNYLASNNDVLKELSRRDKSFEEGRIRLINRQQLTARLKKRRDDL